MSSDYRPKLDTTAELDTNDITIFEELIGNLRWATEIGRVDILHEVFFLSAFKVSPPCGAFTSCISHICFCEKESENENIF